MKIGSRKFSPRRRRKKWRSSRLDSGGDVFLKMRETAHDLGIGDGAIRRLRDAVEPRRREDGEKGVRCITCLYLIENILNVFVFPIVGAPRIRLLSDGVEEARFLVPNCFFAIKSHACLYYGVFWLIEKAVVDEEE